MEKEMYPLFVILAAIIILALVAKFVKGVAKAIALAVVIIMGLLVFGVITKDQVKEAAEIGKGIIAGEFKDEDGLTGIIDGWFQ